MGFWLILRVCTAMRLEAVGGFFFLRCSQVKILREACVVSTHERTFFSS